MTAAMFAQTVEHGRAAAAQFRGRTPQMAIERAALHQLCQCCLLDAAATQVVVQLGGDKILAHAPWADDIAKAQPREEHLRKAADVDHPVVDIERSKCRDGD